MTKKRLKRLSEYQGSLKEKQLKFIASKAKIRNSGEFFMDNTLKNKIISSIVSCLPDSDILYTQDICKLGILGISPQANLVILRKNKRGPNYLQVAPKTYVYPKKDFIEWLYNKSQFRVSAAAKEE